MKKTVLITGASRGIGRACALKFARDGYNVAVVYNRSGDAAKSLCRELADVGTDYLCLRADVRSEAELKSAIATAADAFGGIDVLVNNAGIASAQKPFDLVSDEELSDLFDVNVYGPYRASKLVFPYMIKNHSGSIVNVSSIWGLVGGSCEVAYSASKAAVIGFTKALAKELGPSGIRVNCVAPGVIATDMNAHLSDDAMSSLSDETPLCRIGSPDEVADVVLYLSSDRASFVTGQIIACDGGISM